MKYQIYQHFSIKVESGETSFSFVFITKGGKDQQTDDCISKMVQTATSSAIISTCTIV